jgi:hypothetical protein
VAARNTGNETATLQLFDHAVDARRRDGEEALDVGLGGWATVDQGVGVDEGQVLALGFGEFLGRKSCHVALDLIKSSSKEPA